LYGFLHNSQGHLLELEEEREDEEEAKVLSEDKLLVEEIKVEE
jgi:hypothetical protein